MKAASSAKDVRHAAAVKNLEELLRICDEQGTAIDGMTKEEAMAHMRRVRERLWRAKHPPLPRKALGSPKPGACEDAPASKTTARPDHRTAAQLLEELFRVSAEEGTAADGMTKEEVITHMRRVRERLWKAKHGYRARQQ